MNHIGMTAQARIDAGNLQPVAGQVCALFAVDIAEFSSPARDNDVRAHLRTSLYTILERAFDSSGIPWASCFNEDRGDGVLVIVPPDVPGWGITDLLPERLRSLIRRHNHISSAAAQLQLRAAAHIGPVDHDGRGFTGIEVSLLFRMLESRPLKRTPAIGGADLALIISDYVYRNVVSRHPSLISHDDFRPVRFQVKGTRTLAWTYVPENADQDARSDTDQAMTAFRVALTRMDSDPGEAARIRTLANATDAQMAAETESETHRDMSMPVPAEPIHAAVEPLTEREQEVLTRMASMLSTAEVASELYISVNTVKTHLRSIYRKLAATHRSEAVRRARELNLL